jgi:hypothetical protein
MWQDKRCSESLDSFQVQGLLPLQFFSAALATAAKLVVLINGNLQKAGCSLHAAVFLFFAAPDVQVSAGNEFGERNLHVLSDALNLSYSLGLDFFEERNQRLLLQNARGFGRAGDLREWLGRECWLEITNNCRFAETGLTTLRNFNREQPFVDGFAHAINHPGSVEVKPGGTVVPQ